MRLLATAAALALVLTLVPTAAAQPWTCAFPPRAFVCAGEYDMGDDAPGCAVTGTYAWVTTGTSAAAWGMGCESGSSAMGAGGTAANTTAAGVQWYSWDCFFVYVVEYINYQWTIVPVCQVGAPPEGIDWGHLTP